MDDEQKTFPEASTVLKEDFYVDDLLTGTIVKARQIRDELNKLLAKGEFDIRKWTSNKR